MNAWFLAACVPDHKMTAFDEFNIADLTEPFQGERAAIAMADWTDTSPALSVSSFGKTVLLLGFRPVWRVRCGLQVF